MKRWISGVLCLLALLSVRAQTNPTETAPPKDPVVKRSLSTNAPARPVLPNARSADAQLTVYILPIRENIMPPLVYLVRRGVKEAMEAKADVLVIDMETHGGRVDVTEEIIEIINKFQGLTVTYVNRKAFSAGAFISFATQKIYMAPQSVIGAAAPILMSPTGGAEGMSDTLEAKTTSAISALVRANAEKNGHNVEVADAMVKKTKELIIDGKTLNEKGQILTLTNREAEQEYGDPPKPLLSLGTIDSMDALLEEIGFASARRVQIEASGAEKMGFWINTISPLLLIIGVIGLYIEFKTPGFGLPGIVGVTSFAIYFLGGYIAGLSGMEWVAIFVLGLALVFIELFLFPGTIVVGLAGAALMLMAIVMAMVDMYPGMPSVPSLPQLKAPIQDIIIALVGSIIAVLLIGKFLPRTSVYHVLVSQSASGMESVARQDEEQAASMGLTGVAISPLRPGGKAQFGERVLDVVSQGDLIPKGEAVRIIGHRGGDALVEKI